jgi:hypothetical protein
MGHSEASELLPANDHLVAVMFDLVDPISAGGRF